MIKISPSQRTHEVPLAAVSYSSDLKLSPIVRLISEPLVESETRVLETFGLNKHTHTLVGYTPKRTIGFPAWPILTDPDKAHHALNLVADIEWARRQAKAQPKRVRSRINRITGTLQASAPHFLPTLLEEIARIFADAGNLTYAKQYFTKARKVERNHNLTIDPERHTQAFTEFAALGLISAKALTQEARDATARIEPQKAYDYFLTLLVNQAKASVPLYTNAFKDLQFLGTNAGKSTTDVEQELVAAYLPTRGYAKTPATVLKKIVSIAPALLKTSPETGKYFFSSIPTCWDANQYVAALRKLNLWETLCADTTTFSAWVEKMVAHGNNTDKFFHTPNPDLLDALASQQDTLAGLPLFVDTTKFHLDYLDALTAAGTKWETEPNKLWWISVYNYDEWFNNHYRDLTFLITREDIRDEFVKDLPPAALEEHLDVLLAAEPTRKLIGWKLETYRKLREKTTGSMKEWRFLLDHIKHIDHPSIRELYPELVKEILHFDPAEELAERLRRGTIVEYTWPTFEKICDELEGDVSRVSATYPWVCVRFEKDLFVISGETVRKYQLPTDVHPLVIPTDDDVLVQYYGSIGKKWMWLNSGIPHAIADAEFRLGYPEYATFIGDTFYVGSVPLRDGDVKSIPATNHVGFGPIYADVNGKHVLNLNSGEKVRREEFEQQLAEGRVPGLDLPDIVATAADSDARFSFYDSFTATITDDTAQSPLGVDGDRLYGCSFTQGQQDSWYVSPLGTFHTKSEHQEFYVVRKPHSGFWFLRKGPFWHLLYDGATDTAINAPCTHNGETHPLDTLPPAAFHQLKVRNEKASAKMRNCTTQQAAQLLKNPARIVEFVENDSVLAAAVAGIIVDISEIPAAKIELPVLDEVPQELEFLYSSLPLSDGSGESAIPLPPCGLADEDKEAFRRLAEVLNSPRGDGAPGISSRCDEIVETIGREKIWLAQLATPGACLDDVRSFCEFLHWCADYNVLGTWRRVSLGEEVDMDVWEDKQLILSRGGSLLWNPSVSDRPVRSGKNPSLDGELFVPKVEFKRALDGILAWHEKRHAEGTWEVPAWGGVAVSEVAARVAAVTTLTSRHWACLFMGLFDKPGLGYVDPMTWISAITPEKVSDLLGYSTGEIYSCARFHDRQFEFCKKIFRGCGWHEDYLTQGPNVAAIGAAWVGMWGESWIFLTDEMWDAIPASLHRRFSGGFHAMVRSHSVDEKEEILIRLLPVYLNVAHLVRPSSAVARNLAENILEAKQCVVADLHVPLGCDYRSKWFRGSAPKSHSLRLVKEGFLDSLLDYLISGSLGEGAKEDPSISAPNIVADAAETLSISTNAARYFLQLLALTRPMDTHVKKWNGWTKKQLDQATEELVAKELVVTAKRAGTGRTVFLPGGWLEKSTTGPAMEVWKAPHYLLWKDTKCRPIVETCPPLMPYPELFTEVWERYKSGDTPGYEELTTTRYRRKR